MGSNDNFIPVKQGQHRKLLKDKYNKAEELEHLIRPLKEQQAQLEFYKNKYFQVHHQMGLQSVQITKMKLENRHINDQVNQEVVKVKNRFREKLKKIMVLPEILRATRFKLSEARQMFLFARKNNEMLLNELSFYIAKVDELQRKPQSDKKSGKDEAAQVDTDIDVEELQRKFLSAVEENEKLKEDLSRIETIAEQNNQRVQEKLHEIAQLVSQLETVREESAQLVTSTKENCERECKCMLNQNAALEQQLIEIKAQVESVKKNRNDIRQKVQRELDSLNENFEKLQKIHVRNLQKLRRNSKKERNLKK